MVLGTNPISLGAPANNGDNFVLDMATTATALGKVYQRINDTLKNERSFAVRLSCYHRSNNPIG